MKGWLKYMYICILYAKGREKQYILCIVTCSRA